jgi:hypothetical protein
MYTPNLNADLRDQVYVYDIMLDLGARTCEPKATLYATNLINPFVSYELGEYKDGRLTYKLKDVANVAGLLQIREGDEARVAPRLIEHLRKEGFLHGGNEYGCFVDGQKFRKINERSVERHELLSGDMRHMKMSYIVGGVGMYVSDTNRIYIEREKNVRKLTPDEMAERIENSGGLDNDGAAERRQERGPRR